MPQYIGDITLHQFQFERNTFIQSQYLQTASQNTSSYNRDSKLSEMDLHQKSKSNPVYQIWKKNETTSQKLNCIKQFKQKVCLFKFNIFNPFDFNFFPFPTNK